MKMASLHEMRLRHMFLRHMSLGDMQLGDMCLHDMSLRDMQLPHAPLHKRTCAPRACTVGSGSKVVHHWHRRCCLQDIISRVASTRAHDGMLSDQSRQACHDPCVSNP